MTIQTIISTNMNRNGRDHIEALRQAGYRVIEAASIEEAFRMAGQDGEAFLLLQGVDDKRFAILADSASALLWMNRPDGCEFVNRAYLDFLGVRDVDVRGFDWAQFVHLDDRKSYVTSYLEAVVERRFFEATFRFRRYDGQYRWMKSVGTPRFGPAGDFLGYVGSTIDVTDVHQDMEMNQPNAISPGRIRSTFFEKLTAIPPVLLTGGVLAIAMLLRISLTPLFGSGYTFITFYPATMFSTVIAGWRYGLATAAASAMLSILLFLDPFNNVEHAVALGVFLIVDGLMIVIADSTRQARHRSEIQAALGVAREEGLRDEIEARKRVEEALRESEERLQAILDHAQAAIFIKDAEGRSLFMNEYCAKVLGVDARAANGKTEYELFPRELADQFRANDAQVWKSGKLSVVEEYIPSMEGLRTYLSQKFLLPDRQGAPYALCGIATDITDRKQTEAALRVAAERAEVAQEAAGATLYEFWPQTGAVARNASMRPVLGYLPDELEPTAVGWKALVHPDDVDEVFGRAERAFQHDFGWSMEYRVRHKDGPYIWVFDRARILRDSQGAVERVVGMVIDITERKRVEKALEEQRQLLKSMTDNADVALFIMDERQHCIFMNPAADRLTGFTLGEVRARPLHEYVHHTRPDGKPYPLSECPIDRALPEDHRIQGEEVFVHKDGHLYHVAFTASPLRDQTGVPVGTIIEVQDITERKQAEENLRESEERYRATFANAAVGIGRVAFHNATWIDVNEALCRLVGYSREEMLRTPWPKITHPEDLDLDLIPFRRMADGRLDSYTVEKRFIHKEGHCVWARLTLSLVRDAEGHPLYEICIAEDIQERKWAESILLDTQERLERWNQELEQAVHEKTAELQQSQARLRALASELTLTEQRERKRLATELHDHLQQMLVVGKMTIRQGKRHMMGLPQCEAVFKKVDDILAEALTYSRTLVAELSPPVLRDHGLVMGIRWLVDYMKQKHEHRVTVLVPERTEIKLSEDQTLLLFQSVRELLINSAKHAGTGEATVTLEDRQGQLSITVSDRGQGFDLAAAAAAARTPGGGISSKFGLFSIQERMRALGGTFDIQSAPGQGTIARLTLPFGGTAADETREGTEVKCDLSVSEDSALSPPSSALAQDVKIRVLLVDDHTLIRQSLGAMLNGYPDMTIVGEAANGEEAVQLVEELHPAVVVMDINMPKMDGSEATRLITSRHPDIAVIGLSVNTAVENQEAMSRAGAVRLMAKESAMEELYSAIQEAAKR